ncbi:SET domain protein [Cordyceps fumosorosea ARSEF 2679]|uniref:SET domain protein n=1 Tax=Cordyceps fumosorosea (strain ARSEF 2679) TaxID=1081104 RepID=A0A167QJC2_CORFA|nr:SET domain protein [Cordyceps fumosorosea ARSEF 2679]OAA57694.1 SET domain protein [Cordyceps fumosorosea ARSEF 2679]
MSASPQLSIESLPAWATLQDVKLQQVGMRHIDGKGYGLVAEGDLSASENLDDSLEIMRVPADLVLSGAAVEEYAKVDHNFKQLMEAVGRKSTRLDIMIYLLVHIVSGRHAGDKTRRCVSSPWSEYIKFLPRDIPVPTLWTETHQLLLRGTSLEDALEAKVAALESEFDTLRDTSATLTFWNQLLWEADGAKLSDWLLVDAWYRSRCLELPHAGEAMVPALDMVNHSGGGSAMAYYEEETGGDVSLRIRPGAHVPAGSEVTISYGDSKSAAEMLFSYGFIDTTTTKRQLTLRLNDFPDDPLALAKRRVFGSAARVVTIRQGDGDTAPMWESGFVHLMCLNEEDGLEFRVLQDDAGGRTLRLFWQEEDVTARAHEFDTLLRDHPLAALFRLRAVTVVQERAASQLEKLAAAPSGAQLEALVVAEVIDQAHVDLVGSLRDIEHSILQDAVAEFEEERSQLVENETVVAYLRSMEDGQNQPEQYDATAPADDGDNDDDFS